MEADGGAGNDFRAFAFDVASIPAVVLAKASTHNHGVDLTKTRGAGLAPQLPPGVMGPGFRQDDNRYAFSPAGENR